jgi:hypothetical protein
MKVIKREDESYLIDIDGVELWIDTYKDEDDCISMEWNKYIFYLNDKQDIIDKKTQEGFDKWEELEEIIQYFNEIK